MVFFIAMAGIILDLLQQFKKKGPVMQPLVGQLTRQESWCVDFLVHHAF
jgi:hypothetical protein